jgi:UDP-glucose:(heptosyl)LPS alpha-1,3-glucosyltransferase
MNVALVISRADPERGGAERYTTDIAAALARRGHGVSLLATRFGEAIEGVRFVEIPARGATRAGRYLAFLNGLDAHFAGQRYDLVHAMLPLRRCDLYHPHAGMAKAGLQTHLSRSSAATRVLAGLANRLNRKRRLYAEVEEKLIRSPQKPWVLYLSEYVKGMILRLYPELSDQLVKLFNGTDLGLFDPAQHAGARSEIRRRFNIPSDAVVALMIAQHFERKGLGEVIAATAKLAGMKAEAAPYVLVVGKDDPSASRQQARQLGVEDRVIFAGQTTSSADFYAASDFFVLPTRHDSCSLVVLEALCMGLPVISTVFNGACEVMEEGVHGYVLADPADVEGLAAAMRKLMDRETRARMSEACLGLRERLSFEGHVDRVEEIYRLRSQCGESANFP